jgi:hypothetical protein
MQFDRYIGQTPIKNLHIPRSNFLNMEVFDRSLTNIPKELVSNFVDRILTSNPMNKISNVWSGSRISTYIKELSGMGVLANKSAAPWSYLPAVVSSYMPLVVSHKPYNFHRRRAGPIPGENVIESFPTELK